MISLGIEKSCTVNVYANYVVKTLTSYQRTSASILEHRFYVHQVNQLAIKFQIKGGLRDSCIATLDGKPCARDMEES